MIPYSRQLINRQDIEAVKNVLKSDFLTQGDLNNKFEKKISKKFGSKYTTTFSSGTSALHIACLALGVKKNDMVWTCTNSFVASSNCALYCGASIDLIDIDLENYNLSIDDLKLKLADAKKKKNFQS